MESSAPTVALADCADILTGFPFKSADYAEQGRRLLRGDNIVQGSLRWEGVKYWPSEILVQSQYQLLEGDIVLAMDRPWIEAGLKCARIGLRDTGSLLVQRVARLRANHQTHPGYLYAVIRSRDFTDYILGIQTGTGVPHISKSQIGAFRLRLPVISEQEAIGELVATIDDRISILSFANETLESLSQSIFKSWFVDFDPVRAKAEGREPEGMDAATAALFPDDFKDSELTPIPNGWSASPFDRAVTITSGGTPKTSRPEFWDGSIPWFSIADAPSGSEVFVIQTEKTISKEGLNSCAARLLPVGATIISARGTVGKLAITGVEMAINQSCYALLANRLGRFATFFQTAQLIDVLRQRAHGAVFSTITRDTLASVSVVVPLPAIAEQFELEVGPLMEKILNNRQAARTLAELRDTLLPRLISGKLRVPEAEKMLETVA